METCNTCGIVKPIEAFIGFDLLRDFTGQCIDCMKRQRKSEPKSPKGGMTAKELREYFKNKCNHNYIWSRNQYKRRVGICMFCGSIKKG